jgi:hypothetical protein
MREYVSQRPHWSERRSRILRGDRRTDAMQFAGCRWRISGRIVTKGPKGIDFS